MLVSTVRKYAITYYIMCEDAALAAGILFLVFSVMFLYCFWETCVLDVEA